VPAFDRSGCGLRGPCDRGATASDRLRAGQQRARVLARPRRGLPRRLEAEAARPRRPCRRRSRARLRDRARGTTEARPSGEAHSRHVGVGDRPVRAAALPDAEAARAQRSRADASTCDGRGGSCLARAGGGRRLAPSSGTRGRASRSARMRARRRLAATPARRGGPSRERRVGPRLPRVERAPAGRVRLVPAAGCRGCAR
jgi:hypothetical protein